MTSLYSLRSTPKSGEWVVMKFDPDYEVESVYALSASECMCPAGHQPTCRHRKMLPLFLQHNHVDDGWFLDWDTRLWRHPIGEPAPLSIEPTGESQMRLAGADCKSVGIASLEGSSPSSPTTLEATIAHSLESEASKSALNSAQEDLSPLLPQAPASPSVSRSAGAGAIHPPLAGNTELKNQPASLLPGGVGFIKTESPTTQAPFKKRKIVL